MQFRPASLFCFMSMISLSYSYKQSLVGFTLLPSKSKWMMVLHISQVRLLALVWQQALSIRQLPAYLLLCTDTITAAFNQLANIFEELESLQLKLPMRHALSPRSTCGAATSEQTSNLQLPALVCLVLQCGWCFWRSTAGARKTGCWQIWHAS